MLQYNHWYYDKILQLPERISFLFIACADFLQQIRTAFTSTIGIFNKMALQGDLFIFI